MRYFDRYGSFHVTIERTRWQVYIKVDAEDESEPTELVVSADAAFSNHDGIWMGTQTEFDEEMGKL
jgi:hypothetical protein